MPDDIIDTGALYNGFFDPAQCGTLDSPVTPHLRHIRDGYPTAFPEAVDPAVPDLKPLDREFGGLPETTTVTWGTFIRLSRTLRRLWSDMLPPAAVVWVYLALRAAYRLTTYRGHTLAIGQAFCPIAQIGRECGMARPTVKRALDTLDKAGWITRAADGGDGATIITVKNYDELAQADTDYVVLHHRWLKSCLWKQDPAVIKVALDHLMSVNFKVIHDDRPPDLLDAGQMLRSNASICKSCGVSPSTVTRAHRTLADIGFLDPIAYTAGSSAPSLITVRWFKKSQKKWTSRRLREEQCRSSEGGNYGYADGEKAS